MGARGSGVHQVFVGRHDSDRTGRARAADERGVPSVLVGIELDAERE
jgi:hypothetical protein